MAESTPAPHTPHPPFSPPRRYSSLTFASNLRPVTLRAPLDDAEVRALKILQTPQTAQAVVVREQLLSSPTARDGPAQLHKILHAAQGALHRDMFAASSPASSIESRMNLEQSDLWHPEGGTAADIREWRYSTAPQILAKPSLDVREPLPSPTLPHTTVDSISPPNDVEEPVSSGFVSPTTDCQDQNAIEAVMEALPSNNIGLRVSGVHAANTVVDNELDQDLQRLQFDSDESEPSPVEESPTLRHLRSRSCGQLVDLDMPASPVNSIYLSPSAEAAAESAKARRKWMRGIFPDDGDDEMGYDEEEEDMVGHLPDVEMICPDPMIHRLASATPCPEPSLHSQSPSLYRRPIEMYDSNPMVSHHQRDRIMYMAPNMGTHRATATGSPMPFTKFRTRPPTAHSNHQRIRMSPTPSQSTVDFAPANEHFQPSWYYAKEAARPSPRPTYAFSTAASKAVGSNPAPDSRMRDSYKTDTLTALPMPTSRYRKNGIGAEIAPRGVRRYYQRPPSSNEMRSSRRRPSSRQTYASEGEVRFRSSPPRALAPDGFPPLRRKRAMDDSFLVAEDIYRPGSADPRMVHRARGNMMEMDEYTERAVRTSVFGASTPEALRSARQGIMELSPNVQLYRKGTQENQHLRKKRRPSYWDNDLKEVRESPAGRGGVRSPVSAQESMRAEFEEASQKDADMDVGGEEH